MKNYNFFDTSSLLMITDSFLEKLEEPIIISSITLIELEEIKNSINKDEEIKYAARRILNIINEHPDLIQIYVFTSSMLKPLQEKDICYINNDLKILATAIDYDNRVHPDETIFISNDIALKNIANLFFGEDSINSYHPEENEYCGYSEVYMSDEEMSYFYENPCLNIYNLYINQYLIIRDLKGELKDCLCWTGEGYRGLNSTIINSDFFGQIKPFKNDIYQKLAIDSLFNNQLTILRGPAGSGKSYLGFAYLYYLLEHHAINKIYMFCNPVATKDSAKLGFYPGSKNDKLLDSQIGHFLVGKLGDASMVERLIQEGKLILIPISDCRGMDIGENAGVYLTEAQNTTSDIMKLMLQRLGENTKCVIEGDDNAQVDLISYEGNRNGLRRASKIFRGQDFYGEIKLKNCYRSRIAKVAEEM